MEDYIDIYQTLDERLFSLITADNSKILADSENESMVILLEASWGMGKSTFINNWGKKYNGKCKVIRYNAWENDDYPNAFEPLFCRIIEELVDESNLIKSIKLEMNFSKIINGLGKKAVSYGIKRIDEELAEMFNDFFTDLDINNYKEWFPELDFEDIKNIIKKLDVENIYNQLSQKKYIEFQKLRYKKKKKLTELVNHEKNKKEFQDILNDISSENTVIIIDELDRCKPTFALETLEFIKHYFKNKKITFILAVDSKHLAASIESLYGLNIDAFGYINRFYDIKIKMPLITPNRSLYIREKIKHYFNDPTPCSQKQLVNLMTHFKLSLRDINLVLRSMEILHKSLRNERYVVPSGGLFLTYIYFIILKINFPNVYETILFENFEVNPDRNDGHRRIDRFYVYVGDEELSKRIINLSRGANSNKFSEHIDSKRFKVHTNKNDLFNELNIGEYINYILAFV